MNDTPVKRPTNNRVIIASTSETPILLAVSRPHPRYLVVASIFRLSEPVGGPAAASSTPEMPLSHAMAPENGRVLWAVGETPDAAMSRALRDLGERPEERRWDYVTEPAPGEPAAMLTPRQLEVARLIAAGMPDEGIGNHLDTAPRTASAYVRELLQTLGFQSRSQIAAYIACEHPLDQLAGRWQEEHHEPVRRPTLTEQQWKVARLIEAGRSNSQIATALGCSQGTVGSHVHNILRRLGVENRIDIARFVRERCRAEPNVTIDDK